MANLQEQDGFRDIQVRSGLIISFNTIDGAPYRQLHPRKPRIILRGGKKRAVKYENPTSRPTRMDLGSLDLDMWDDAITEVFQVESPVKASAIEAAGGHAVGMVGIAGWKSALARHDLGRILRTVREFNRTIKWYVCPDSNYQSNENVQGHTDDLVKFCRKYVDVYVIVIPPPPDGHGVVGPDDYLASGHTLEDLKSFALSPRELELMERTAQEQLRIEAREQEVVPGVVELEWRSSLSNRP